MLQQEKREAHKDVEELENALVCEDVQHVS